jgi:hypothetical protein
MYYYTWIVVFQVHARNILRALYKETKLGEDVFPYVADGVQVAVEGFLSEIWAVSCLLFCIKYYFILFLDRD